FDDIADWFETLAKAERSHTIRYEKALKDLVD
ncbi:MAG: Rubrerythrin, partial [Pseudomonadota bacterium]